MMSKVTMGLPEPTCLSRLYYWKGLKASVNKHIKQCMMCPKEKHTNGKISSAALVYPKATDAISINGFNKPL